MDPRKENFVVTHVRMSKDLRNLSVLWSIRPHSNEVKRAAVVSDDDSVLRAMLQPPRGPSGARKTAAPRARVHSAAPDARVVSHLQQSAFLECHR